MGWDRVGSWTHRQTLPAVANRYCGSNGEAYASGGSHDLNTKIFFKQEKGGAILRVSNERQNLARRFLSLREWSKVQTNGLGADVWGKGTLIL